MPPGHSTAGVPLTLRDGAVVTLRPIRPEDEPLLALTCRVDAAVGLAIVAEHAPGAGERAVVGLGRLTRTVPPDAAEVALLVVDRWHGLGLGTAMMHELVVAARTLGLRRLYGDMLADNDAMRAVVRHAGFVIRTVPGDAKVLRAELTLA